MEETIIDRLLTIPNMEGISKNKFETSLGKTSGYLNVQKKRNGIPGVDVVQKLVSIYPNYCLQWVLFGKGPVKTEPKSVEGMVMDPVSEYQSSENVDRLFIKMVLSALKEPEIKQAIKEIVK